MATKLLKQYQILFKKAKVDLHSAKLLLKSFNSGDKELDLDVIFFHLQQSSEKLIKVLLDFNNIKFPHTHDIEDLIMLLDEKNIHTIDEINKLERLSEFAAEGRYSILHDDLENTEEYILILDNLLDFIVETIFNKLENKI